MKKVLSIALGCALLGGTAWAQNRNCGTMDNLSRIESMDRGYADIRARVEAQTQRFVDSYHPQGEEVVYNIPVVVHVIYSTSSQNISDAQVASQIDVLNKDFRRLNTDAGNTPSAFASIAADCEINFCLATVDPNGNATNGITRTSTSVSSWGTNDAMKYSSSGGKDAWPASQYLNLWVCNLGGGILGYAQFPGSGAAATDGVVIGYNYFGTTGTATAPFNKGRTATHEVGHWLNLYHIWGDDGTSCSGSDNVSDTPNQAGENYGCPSFPRLDACTSSGNGVMFMNYMDYTDDACMNMFTQGQKARMVAQLAAGGQRSGLASSPGCGSGGGGGGSSYCASKGNSTSDEWINSVVVGSNSNTSGNNGGYADFSSISWNLTAGSSYSVTLTPAFSGTTYNEGWAIWIDLNGNGSFTDAGEQLFTSSAVSSSAQTGTISIPAATGAGAKRMRVSMKYNGVPTACETFSYGEVEDYTVNISTGVSCGTPGSLSATSITTSSATLSWSAVSGASSYNLQVRASGSSSWTTFSISGTSTPLSGLAASTSYQFQVQAVCSGTNGSYSSIGSFTTASVPVGCTDSYESNNTTSTAKTISRNSTISASIGSSTDVDYYKFTTSSTTGYKVRIDLTNLPADYDVRLYRGTTTQVGISQNGGTSDESIIYNYTSAATYYIKVYGYNGVYSTTQCYNLRASVQSSNFREGDLPAPVAKDMTLVTEDEMEVFPNPTNAQLYINYLALNGGNGTVMVMDLAGKVLVNQAVELAEGLNSFDFNMGNYADGLYIVRMQVGDKVLNRKVQVAH